MDPINFDRLTRSLSCPASRRGALAILAGALSLLGEVAPGVAKRGHHSGAKKAHQHSGKKRHRHDRKASERAKPTCGKVGAACTSTGDCCGGLSCTGNSCAKATSGSCASGQIKCGSSCCAAPANGTPTCSKNTCDFTCNAGYTNCGGTCVNTTSDTANCGVCGHACEPGEDCCGSACDPLITVTNCGACGHVCPGYQKPNTNVTCQQGGTCTFSCQGETYDVDGDPSTGCEATDTTVGNHTQASAVDLGNQSCNDGQTGTFSGVILSDARVHEIPAVIGFDVSTGSAPDWYVVHATGGICNDDLAVTLTISEGTPTCYHLTVITDKGTFNAQVGGNGTATITQTNAYSDDTDIYFQVKKTCGTSTLEKASYSAQFHL